MKRLINELRGDCGTDTKVVLAGYSQGAEVMGKALQLLNAANAALVSGVMVLGDPAFNPTDSDAVVGSYNPGRSGLLGYRVPWGNLTSAPSVSFCLEFDLYCQARSKSFTDEHPSAVLDLGPIIDANGGIFSINKVHESYVSTDSVILAANKLALRMGYPVDAEYSYAGAVDVVFLIDTSSASAAVLPELQARASDLINRVAINVRGARYSVIQYSQGNAVNVTDGFTADSAEAISAIEQMHTSPGQYGAIYSAIAEANALDWRDTARKVSLTLSTSRVCADQYCGAEAVTGVGSTTLRLGSGSDGRRAGVYTRDNQWFFESAGWIEAIDGRYESRPGEGQLASLYIDELVSSFARALTDPAPSPIAGMPYAVAGQSTLFNADSLVPFYATSTDRRLVWHVERTGDLGGGGDGGGGASRGSAARSEGEPLTEDPELPADMGPLFQADFAESGMYRVGVTAYLDGEVYDFDVTVRVEEVPSAAPASPLLQSTVINGAQLLAWTAGEGEPAKFYGIVDTNGDIIETLIPVEEIGSNGIMDFEIRVPLASGEAPRYSVIAINELGATGATALLTATDAVYAHVTEEAGVPSGGILELSGAMTPELEAIAAASTIPGAPLDLAGDYEAVFASPSGDQFQIDMNDVEAAVNAESIWAAEFHLRESLTMAGDSVGDLMNSGFADELLAGGYLEFHVGAKTVRVKVSPTADAIQLDEYIIDSNSPPPTGATASTIVPDQAQATLGIGYNADPATLPFVAEALDPLQDWSAAIVSDVRTWIGNAEVQNTLTSGAVWVTGSGSPEAAGVVFNGDVVGGTPALMRDFLQNGTLSFRVDGGQPTIFTLGMSTQDAAAGFPDLADPPALVGRSDLKFTQYQDDTTWKPVIDWGSSPDEGRIVVQDGQLPDGLWWDWDTHTIFGVPLEQGTYPIAVTATGDSGQATKTYNVIVGPRLVASEPVVLDAELYVSEGVADFHLSGSGYFRPDNPSVATNLPIVEQFVANGGYIYGEITDVMLLDGSGQPIPITGSFLIDMWQPWNEEDRLSIAAYGVELVTPGSQTLAELLATGGSLSFRYGLGDTNTVTFH